MSEKTTDTTTTTKRAPKKPGFFKQLGSAVANALGEYMFGGGR